MNPQIAEALVHDRTIDITTTGRKSGTARRIEIWFHNLDGKLYITGAPGRRAVGMRICLHIPNLSST